MTPFESQASNQIVDHLLQPLRVTPGWRVDYNIFTHYDPAPETAAYFYGSTLFAATYVRSGATIELAFAPEGDPNGSYRLTIFPHGRFRSDQVRTVVTRDRLEVVTAIERFFSTLE